MYLGLKYHQMQWKDRPNYLQIVERDLDYVDSSLCHRDELPTALGQLAAEHFFRLV